MLNRITKLDKCIQEYVQLGIKCGLINNDNLNRIISRLERVNFSIDNNNPGDAQTTPIRDSQNVRISKGLDVKINEKKTLKLNKYYFKDEVVFHELTHCINGIYENWFENLSLWFDFDKIFLNNFIVKEDRIEELSKNPQYRQKAYAWLVLDEFVAQYVAQILVEEKYGKKIYEYENKQIKQSDPIITINTNLADYHEFYDIVLKFIEPIYGNNINQFICDSLNSNIINKIFNYYSKISNGAELLYSLLGEMGNIGFAVASKNFTEDQCSSDNDMIARNPKNFFSHYNNFLYIIDSVLKGKTFIPGIKGSFGNGLK